MKTVKIGSALAAIGGLPVFFLGVAAESKFLMATGGVLFFGGLILFAGYRLVKE